MTISAKEGKKINWKKHLLVFVATLLIFGSGFLLSNTISSKRLQELTQMQENLSIDILSLETQFSILAQAPCQNLNESTLTQELYEISQKLEMVGSSLGESNTNFLRLKKYYSILEIKHWLLLKRAVKECKLDLAFVIYFYADKKQCPECQDQGYILTQLREKYPFLRVYSFDYGLPLAALQTLESIYKLKEEIPILVINDNVYYGFKTKEKLEEILSQYIELEPPEGEATSTATSTATSSNARKKQ